MAHVDIYQRKYLLTPFTLAVEEREILAENRLCYGVSQEFTLGIEEREKASLLGSRGRSHTNE